MNSLLPIIIALAAGYQCGTFLTAVHVVKHYTGKDVSELGSGNPGMANVMARLGKKPGFIVLAGDIIKTVLAMLITFIFCGNRFGMTISDAFLWSGLGTLLGHNFPYQRKFKGGKGVTVSCVWIIFLMPFGGIVSAVAGGLIVLLTGLLPLGAVLITAFAIPFAYMDFGLKGALIMGVSFVIMLIKHFPGFIRGFKNEEKREFKRERNAKAVLGVLLVIMAALCLALFYNHIGRGLSIYDLTLTAPEEIDIKADAVSEDGETDLIEVTEDINFDDEAYNISIAFAGDINLDENWSTTRYLDTCENGIRDCIDVRLIEKMQAADIMWLNNEFTYSLGGSPLPDKAYTFRAKPERVEVLKELGVDIVGLANNHVYDYGKEALLDTLDTLDAAGIPYVGAGHNLEEAMAPYYIEVEGKRIAFVAASRAEKNKMTPQATDEKPGILRCYDTELFDQEITEAKANADYVIALVHWGAEYSDKLEDVQLKTGREYIDSGADAVIGAHTHCLQGFEFYDGKPIVYSLGNYWFNEKTLDTMLLSLVLSGDKNGNEVRIQITPALQKNYTTSLVEKPEDARALYDYLESISVNVKIDDDGFVSEVD